MRDSRVLAVQKLVDCNLARMIIDFYMFEVVLTRVPLLPYPDRLLRPFFKYTSHTWDHLGFDCANIGLLSNVSS